MTELERYIKKINLPVIFILITSLILTVIWFRHGNIMGTAESGLSFYNFNIQLNLNKEAWSSYTLGFPNNIGVASIPMYWFFAKLQNIGIPSFLIQMTFFWLILVISGIGIFLLTKQFFPRIDNKFLLFPVLFYWFNPFSLINVWNRFLTNFLFSYAFIPFALYLFMRGINQRRYLFAILIGLLSLVCSHAETSMTFNILFWFIVAYTTIFNLLIIKDWPSRVFIIRFFFLTFIFWVLINIWWIGQVVDYFFVGSFSTISATSFTPSGNYQTFSVLSDTLGKLIDLISLRHSYFFSDDNTLWTNIFNNPLLLIIGSCMASIILIPIIFIRNRISLFFGGLFIMGLFLAKGNNPPFGEINDKLFLSFPLMQLFRNPFEKFGYLLAFSATFLFTEGFYELYKFLNQKYRKVVYIFVFVTIALIWGFPFWTGLVFVGFEKPINDPNMGYEVKVPAYYEEASKWLASQKEDFRILAVPFSGEGITYNWEKGYSGLELTNQLLPKSAISLNTNIPFYDDVTKNIEKWFSKTDSLSFIANSLNVKYIILREDVDWDFRKIRNPQTELSILRKNEQLGQLKKVAQFGKLSFWEILSKTKSKIYVSNSAFVDYSKSEIQDLNFSGNDLVINSKDKIDNKIINQLEGEIIHPNAHFFLDHIGDNFFEIRQDLFPYVSILPVNKKYPFVLIKDRLDEGTIKDQDKLLDYRLVILGKRLVEAKFSVDLDSEQGIIPALKEYANLLDRTFNLVKELERSDSGGKQVSLQSKLYSLFSRHIKVLEDLINNPKLDAKTKQEAINTLKKLKNYLVETYIYPKNGFIITDELPLKRRILYSFNVKGSGKYNLLWDQKILDGYYKFTEEEPISLQIDKTVVTTKINSFGKGYISLGEIYLESGDHEIGINLPDAINLITSPQKIDFKVDHGSEVKLFQVNNFDPYSSLGIDFNYWIKKGNGVSVSIYDKKISDITPTTSPIKTTRVDPDLYDYTSKNYFTDFKLPDGADQATISLEVIPWNDCESVYLTKGKQLCKNLGFKSKYDKTTEVEIDDLSVTRDFNDSPLLIKIDKTEISNPPKIEFTKVDETTYEVRIIDATKPFFLIFSELFDPEWGIIDVNGKSQNYQHFLSNGYSNSWYIDKVGNYQIILKFAPQYLLNYGEKISTAAFLVGLILVFLLIYKRKNV